MNCFRKPSVFWSALVLVTALTSTGVGAQELLAVPEPTDTALAFAAAQFQVWLLRTFFAIGLPLLWIASGASERMGARFTRLARGRWPLAVACHGALLGLLFALLTLVVDRLRAEWYAPLVAVPAPALMTWLGSQVGNVLTDVLVGALGCPLLLWFLRLSPRFAWAWATLLISCGIAGYLAFIPMQADIKSGRYQPLTDTAWQQRFDAISAKVNLTKVPIFVEKTSEKSSCRTSNNAAGFGPNQAIVLTDQIFLQWTPEMIEAAYAHELKHYFLDNSWKAAGMVVFLSLLGTVLIQGTVAGGAALSRSLASPVAAVPLLLLGLQLFQLLQPPIFNSFSEQVELEADRFSLELTHHNDARAKIASSPCGGLFLPRETWFRQMYFNNHPDMATRMEFANSYRPWDQGQPLVYAKYMSDKK